MVESATDILVLNLDRAEALDLKRALSDVSDVTIEKPPIDDSSLGVLDPVTLICIPLGALAIQALIVWLSTRRSDEEVTETVEVRHPDGTVETRTVKIRLRESRVDEQAAQIIDKLKVPLGQ